MNWKKPTIISVRGLALVAVAIGISGSMQACKNNNNDDPKHPPIPTPGSATQGAGGTSGDINFDASLLNKCCSPPGTRAWQQPPGSPDKLRCLSANSCG